jgi:hypothetical protein
LGADIRDSLSLEVFGVADDLEYYVLPAESEDPPSFTSDVSFWDFGCALMIAAFVCSWIIDVVLSNDTAVIMILFLLEIGAIFLGFVVSEERSKAQVHAKMTEWVRQDIAKRGNDARSLAQRARETMEKFFKELSSLPELLEDTDSFLLDAEEEFREKAYAPFWDNIEEAAMSLGEFNVGLTRLGAQATSYSRLLTGQIHNFPLLTIGADSLPNPARQAERLRQLVRMGQKDFEFATIWEHRKTQKVIIEGFRTLGEAISNLSVVVDDSFSLATRTIEETASKQREEQVRLRESFDSAVSKWEEQKRLHGQ